jgi:ATP-dependent Clp protease ATP-binding subunit ClpB
MVAQMTEAGLVLEMTDKAKEQLAEEGYDPAYGARPLKRVLQQRVANPMASAILGGKFPQGATIVIDWNLETSQFTFTPKV